MKVWDHVLDSLRRGRVHMTLLDPADQTPERAGEIAGIAAGAGSNAIMVGGSTGLTRQRVQDTVSAIKDATKLPVILFPTAATSLAPNADAIFFMSLLNTKEMRKLIIEQVHGAPFVKATGMEPIGMAYLIVEPGMKAGEVGAATPLPRDDPELTMKYALAAQYLGMKTVYLEAGSGAPEHVPMNIISAVKENIDIPIIVGGGIRDGHAVTEVLDAGADIIVTGTAVEQAEDVEEKLRELLKPFQKFSH